MDDFLVAVEEAHDSYLIQRAFNKNYSITPGTRNRRNKGSRNKKAIASENPIKNGPIIANDKEYEELKNVKSCDCDDCMYFKDKRFNATPNSKAKYNKKQKGRPFSSIYSEVTKVLSNKQSKLFNAPKYFITFRCAITGYTQIYGMERESETYDKICQFLNWVKTQFHLKNYLVAKFIADNSVEYISDGVQLLFSDYGIEFHATSAHTPSSNGNAESFNSTVMNDVITLLSDADLPVKFWLEAAEHSVLLRNHAFKRSINNSPSGFIGRKQLKTNLLHPFGTACSVTNLAYDNQGGLCIYLSTSPVTFRHLLFIPHRHGDYFDGHYEEINHLNFFHRDAMYSHKFFFDSNIQGFCESDFLHNPNATHLLTLGE